MSKKVLVPLAAGFEEIEAVTIVDVLRRAGLEVTVAGLVPGVVRGSRGIKVEPDTTLGRVEREVYDLVVLPGGMGGALALMEDGRVLELLRRQRDEGRVTAAICAAPMVLARAGVVSGVDVTSHPSVRDRLGDARVVADARVVRDGRILTSQGPGTSMEFALALVEELAGAEKAAELAGAMVVAR